MYEKSTSKINTQGKESSCFEIRSGARQGDVVSPLLFIIFMDNCLRDVQAGASEEETVMYADDGAEITSSSTDTQEVGNTWYYGMNANEMKVSTKKAKAEFVVITRTPGEYDIYMDQNEITQSRNYYHLGVNVGEDNLQETEINSRIAKYNKNVGMLCPLVKDRHKPRECKITIYRSILKPILMYGSEIWSLTAKTESKLHAAVMRVLRLVKGVTRRDKIRNANIRGEWNIIQLLEDIKRGRLRWYGHVMRMGEEKKQRRYLEWRPAWKRSVGRPRKRWIEGVDKALQRRGKSLGEVTATQKYENRGECRKFLKNLPADRWKSNRRIGEKGGKDVVCWIWKMWRSDVLAFINFLHCLFYLSFPIFLEQQIGFIFCSYTHFLNQQSKLASENRFFISIIFC